MCGGDGFAGVIPIPNNDRYKLEAPRAPPEADNARRSTRLKVERAGPARWEFVPVHRENGYYR